MSGIILHIEDQDPLVNSTDPNPSLHIAYILITWRTPYKVHGYHTVSCQYIWQLGWMAKFVESYNLLKLTEEKIENLTSPITIK